MKKNKTLQELFSFPGFKATNRLQGKFGDHRARIIVLTRRKKRHNVQGAANVIRHTTTVKSVKYAIWIQRIIEFICVMKGGAYIVSGAKACE